MNCEDTIYLDYAATSPVRPEVLEGIMPFFSDCCGNASSIHSAGQIARGAVEKSRETVAACLGVAPAEIIFTSGGTESDNLAVKGLAYARRDVGRHIIVSAVEHPAVIRCAEALVEDGFELSLAPVDRYGRVEVEVLKQLIRPDTSLISVMLANNETGAIQPVEDICRVASKSGVPVHTDAVQAPGRIDIDVGRMGVDMMSLSAHKCYGPKGVGALYVKKGTGLQALLNGGSQEKLMRPGTENVPGIVGLGIALDLACKEREQEAARLLGLRQRLETGIRQRIKMYKRNGHRTDRLPNILNMSFAGVTGEALTVFLDTQGIAVSSRSACASGSLEPSHVLQAMGVDAPLALASLRFSLGRDTTEEEVDRVVDVLEEGVARFRRLSPSMSAACGPGCKCEGGSS